MIAAQILGMGAIGRQTNEDEAQGCGILKFSMQYFNIQITNYKLQITNNIQIPIPKSQTTNRNQLQRYYYPLLIAFFSL